MTDEAVENPLPLPSETEALASLREFALGPIDAVFTWSEAAAVLELIDLLTTSGIIEVSIRNPSVAEYMRHWEGRTEAAEAKASRAMEFLGECRKQIATIIEDGTPTDWPAWLADIDALLAPVAGLERVG
jgi:hypothetical protein